MTEQLAAPWRLKYIEAAGKQDGCIFCDFPAQSREHDRENLILHRGEHGFIILNAYPYSNGHLMAVPYRHACTLEEYTEAEMLEVMQLTRLCTRVLKTVMNPDAYNSGLNIGRGAGAGIAGHLHWHLVPRWIGDTNFMTVINDIRVIPESLQNTYDRLKEALPAALEGKG